MRISPMEIFFLVLVAGLLVRCIVSFPWTGVPIAVVVSIVLVGHKVRR